MLYSVVLQSVLCLCWQIKLIINSNNKLKKYVVIFMPWFEVDAAFFQKGGSQNVSAIINAIK